MCVWTRTRDTHTLWYCFFTLISLRKAGQCSSCWVTLVMWCLKSLKFWMSLLTLKRRSFVASNHATFSFLSTIEMRSSGRWSESSHSAQPPDQCRTRSTSGLHIYSFFCIKLSSGPSAGYTFCDSRYSNCDNSICISYFYVRQYVNHRFHSRGHKPHSGSPIVRQENGSLNCVLRPPIWSEDNLWPHHFECVGKECLSRNVPTGAGGRQCDAISCSDCKCWP